MEKKSPNRRRSDAFTLVELIVVITILAILGTIGFISIQGYSKSARDSSRVSDLVNLAKAMEFLTAGGWTLPLPDAGMLTISASGTTIGYQGYAGNNVLRTLNLGGKFQDPTDGKHYTYSTNETRTKYQVLNLLEDSENSGIALDRLPGVGTAHAGAYDLRYPLTMGNQLGILLGTGATVNQPTQELYSGSFTGIDVASTTANYTVLFTSKISESGTGAHLKEAFLALSAIYNASTSNWHNVDSNCWKPDVTVGTQTWAGCNSTIGSAAVAYGQTSCSNYAGGSITCTVPPAGRTVSTMRESDYMPGQSDNIYGALYEWSGATNGGLFANGCFATRIPSSNTTCPCKSGYHIPSNAEWDMLETGLGCAGNEKLSADSTGFECLSSNTTDIANGLGWTSTNPNSLKNKLGFTLGGYCVGGSSCDNRGYTAHYWTSSTSAQNPANSWRRYLHYSYASINRSHIAPSADVSVRCIKD